MNRPRLALILCGGGSRGAVEIGLWKGLCELGITVDLVVGSSVGALNGAFIAAEVPAEQLTQLWEQVRARDILSFNYRLLASFKRTSSVYDNYRFRRFIEHHLPARRFDELRIPFIAVGTDLMTGNPVTIEDGNLIDAILASAALPGLFPPVPIDGRLIIDGGISNNCPIDVAIQKGASAAIALRCHCDSDLAFVPNNAAGILARSLQIVADQNHTANVERYRQHLRLVTLEPCLGGIVELLDFRHGRKLLTIGHQTALANADLLREAAFV